MLPVVRKVMHLKTRQHELNSPQSRDTAPPKPCLLQVRRGGGVLKCCSRGILRKLTDDRMPLVHHTSSKCYRKDNTAADYRSLTDWYGAASKWSQTGQNHLTLIYKNSLKLYSVSTRTNRALGSKNGQKKKKKIFKLVE